MMESKLEIIPERGGGLAWKKHDNKQTKSFQSPRATHLQALWCLSLSSTVQLELNDFGVCSRQQRLKVSVLATIWSQFQ